MIVQKSFASAKFRLREILVVVTAFAFVAVPPVVQAAQVPPAGEAKFDFRAVPVSQIIGLVYGQALTVPYVVDPAVLSDERLVSFRFDSQRGDFRHFWTAFLDSLGFVVQTRGGVDFVAVKIAEKNSAAVRDVFVYRPKYRSVGYLVDLLGPLFSPGAFAAQRLVAPAGGDPGSAEAPRGSAAGAVNVDSDTLVFYGTADEIKRISGALPQVDLSAGQVMVKAVVYEVTTGQSEVSAFSLALSVLGGRLGVSINKGSEAENAIRVSTGSIDAVLSAFRGDSRFKAVSTPSLRVVSGHRAQLQVGQEVPTLGSVSYAQGSSAPIQSVEYRSSGVIFGLIPTVRDGVVQLVVDQQISDFSRTETGVNNSPTLTKRGLSTTVNMADGELIVLGGLAQDKATASDSGQSFLPKFMRSRAGSNSRTEVILMLQVTKI
ncbi:type II secretory pathway protein [Janthinobacterium sp. ROICE36]|uniref:type II secretion system protein GspD n=1 Tax=Janthinobacterium sp. ROICE36 TaxID=2048670 RepID=UPI000C7F29AD|nr:type II secretory pathway protein [Janthinobacterium sp. ROICE36]PLY44078.1 type II secretory pathway protein [Janthinobacterium sp. ROICE36]